MSEESVRVLIKRRGELKAAITRISSAVSNVDQSISKPFFNVRLDSIKNLASKYDEIESEIELKVDDFDIAVQDRIEVEYILFSTEERLLELLEQSQSSTGSHHIATNIQLQPIK